MLILALAIIWDHLKEMMSEIIQILCHGERRELFHLMAYTGVNVPIIYSSNVCCIVD